MRNNSKISMIIKTVATILIVSLLAAILTAGFTYAWAYPEISSALDIENPIRQLPKPTISRHNNNITSAITEYEGVVQLRWYDTVENAMWFNIENDDSYKEVCMFINEHHIPEVLYLYLDRVDMYIQATIGEEVVVNDWYLVEKATQTNIGKPSNEDLRDRYELENKHRVVKMGKQPDVVYLAQLAPNTIYSYTPDVNMTQDYPTIINNTGNPCILYTKHQGLDPTYGIYACPEIIIAEDATESFACSFYEAGDEYRIMYTISDNKTLYNIAYNDTINITEFLEMTDKDIFYMYIYNDTDKEYVLSITRDWEEDSVPLVEVLQPGDFIGCWGPSHTIDIQEKK